MGELMDDPLEDIWFVPKMYYRLSRVKMYLADNRSYYLGFEVTYSLQEMDGLDESWPSEITHLFGKVKPTEESIDLTADLEQLSLCTDRCHKGFRFKPYR